MHRQRDRGHVIWHRILATADCKVAIGGEPSENTYTWANNVIASIEASDNDIMSEGRGMLDWRRVW